MLTEEELEQMIIRLIDDKEDELLQLRASVAHHGLGMKRLTEVYENLKGEDREAER